MLIWAVVPLRRIIRSSLLSDTHSDFQQDGQYQCTEGIDTEGNRQFRDCRDIGDNPVKRGRDEPAGNEAQPLVDPCADKNGQTGEGQEDFVLTGVGDEEQDDGGEHQRQGNAHPSRQAGMAVQSHVKVIKVVHVLGNFTVEDHENFATEKKEVGDQPVDNDFGQALDRIPARIDS